jgi:hypothetical protein
MDMRITAGRHAWLCIVLCAACAPPDTETEAGAAAAPAAAPAVAASVPGQALACVKQRPDMDRSMSPYDSVLVDVGGGGAKICYSRPSARGRMVFDSLVPYGTLWRTGANEPTILHTSLPLRIAGIAVPAGSYSIYTIPEPSGDWQVVLNRSISQWGHEGSYDAAVEAQEVGRAPVPSTTIPQPVEQFTIRAEPAGAGAVNVILEWATTRVTIPVTAG